MTSPQDILSRYLSEGEILSRRYQLERVLGSGAYGAIYLANDLIGHERVAVKALPPRDETTSQTAFERFKREMQIIRNLVHKNIIALYDYGETENGVPFMVIEYLEGRTLDALVKNNPMNLEDGTDALAQILSALRAAHEQGIIHRDLKPANVMVSGQAGRYECKVLDFGMAKLLQGLGGENVTQLTREGIAVGTPRYIAPEQARGLQVGPYTDIYAAGLLGYEIFSGARAVKADSIELAVSAHVSPHPLDLPELDRVPAPIQPILLKMMAKAVPERYQHAGQVLADLERLQIQLRRAASGPIPEHVELGGKRASAPAALELDYDRIDAYEEDRRSRHAAEPVQKEPFRLFPPVEHPIEYAERALAPIFALLGFMLMSTIIPVEGVLRALLTAFPMIVCGLLGWALREKGPFTFSRMICLSGMACFILPHVLNSKRVVAELFDKPTWFLAPVAELPGFNLLDMLLTDAARAWITLVSRFL